MPVLLAGFAAAAVALAGPPPDRVGRVIIRCAEITTDRVILNEPPHRVGRVVLRGNVVTADVAVVGALGVVPGQPLPGEADRLRAEIRLLMAFPARFDLAAGRRPTVSVRKSSGSSVYDLEIDFPERAK